jgi:ArsR family transcriptional regulator
MYLMATDQTAKRLDEVLKALADPLRQRILTLVAEHEICVCYLVEVLRTIQPLVSRQLSFLRRAGLVEGIRDGKWIRYRILKPDSQAAAAVLTEILRQFRSTRQSQDDIARLIACSQGKRGQLKGAPPPRRIKR